jgi:epoxyqueuosine reductase
VCPFNRGELPQGDARFTPRPLAALKAADLAALSLDQFQAQAAGMALARSQYDGLRRNALYAIGASRDRAALAVVESLTADPSPIVRAAALWARERLT